MRTPDSNDETEKSAYYLQDTMRPKAPTILWATLLCLVVAGAYAHEDDLTHLPLDDGKISQEPKKGLIWACRIDPAAGGAWRDVPWIDKQAGTFDYTKKAVVPGDTIGRAITSSRPRAPQETSQPIESAGEWSLLD
jgi:hypothetical protein